MCYHVAHDRKTPEGTGQRAQSHLSTENPEGETNHPTGQGDKVRTAYRSEKGKMTGKHRKEPPEKKPGKHRQDPNLPRGVEGHSLGTRKTAHPKIQVIKRRRGDND